MDKKRRDFIKKGSLLSVGLLSSSYGVNGMIRKTGPNDIINIGVIGTGDRGAGLIPYLNEIDGFKIAACCDILPFRLEEGLELTDKKTKGYTNYNSLLDNKNIDAVLIATPFDTHSKIAIDALDAGKNVYCEKTMAKGLEGIDSLVKKARASKQTVQIGHQFHSSRLYKHVADLIKKGEIGEITSFKCQWNRNGDWRRPVKDQSLERAINWRMYREYSGGLVAELSSHQIDFIQMVLGEYPNKIMGVGGIDYWKDGRETFDNIHLIHEFPSGVKAEFTCLTSNALGDYKIMVMGSKGTILLDYGKAWIYYEEGYEKELTNVDGVSGATANPLALGYAKAIEISHLDPSKQALMDFKDNILNSTEPDSNVYTSANTAVSVQLSLDSLYGEKIVNCELSNYYN